MGASSQGFGVSSKQPPIQGELSGVRLPRKFSNTQPEAPMGRNCLDLIHPEDRDHSSRAPHEVFGMLRHEYACHQSSSELGPGENE
jgi:hypothetical protein